MSEKAKETLEAFQSWLKDKCPVPDYELCHELLHQSREALSEVERLKRQSNHLEQLKACLKSPLDIWSRDFLKNVREMLEVLDCGNGEHRGEGDGSRWEFIWKQLEAIESGSQLIETIVWHPVTDEMPDDETTVLLWGPAMNEVDIGYHDNGHWWLNWTDANVEPTHWAHVPAGPEVKK